MGGGEKAGGLWNDDAVNDGLWKVEEVVGGLWKAELLNELEGTALAPNFDGRAWKSVVRDLGEEGSE